MPLISCEPAVKRLPQAAALALDMLLAPLLLCAVLWVRRRQALILHHGAPLTREQMQLAHALGVTATARVRVMRVSRVPLPLPPWLLQWACVMAQRTRWFSLPWSHTAGMTLGHGIVLREDCAGDRRLLAHELVHVSQYERLGGIARFLRQYLRECVWPGYPHGALEREARVAEAQVSRQGQM